MLFQTLDFGLDIILSSVFLILLLVGAIVLYAKVLWLPLNISYYAFSLVIGVLALQKGDIPFTPYFQALYLVIQTLVLLLAILDFKNFN